MIYRFANCELNTERHELRREAEPVSVEPQVFDLLLYLIEHRDRTVTKTELYEQIWRGRLVSEAALSSRIKAARQAVGDNGRDQRVIRTLHGRGFRFVESVDASKHRVAARPSRSGQDGDLQRRLTAILAADLVGYTGLMSGDEAGTLRRLTELRQDVIEPLIAKHRGHLVKLMGDGFLVEFASLVDAVECAVAWQTAVGDRQSDQAQGGRLAFRIGVNLGDVIVEDDDIYGDGVNVASRLEGLAQPGGICLSGDAYRQVRGKVDIAFMDMGERALSNVAEPIRVYSVVADGGATDLAPMVARPLRPDDQPSIAVLPFDNMSGDPEQQYFADGIAEDIITSLSRLSRLLVIARNSSFIYRGRPVKVQAVAEELGVRYVVEGSVRKSGNRVRISGQLIDCTTGGHLWAERFDRELTDIFAVQDEVTAEIVSALALELTVDERSRLHRTGTDNLAAYDHLLRGHEQYRLRSAEGTRQAKAMYEKAVALDPKFVAAWASLADCHLMDHINRWHETADRPLTKAYELAQKAVALDESSSQALVALGNVNLWQKRHDRAIADLRKAIALDPNLSYAYIVLGSALHYAGKSQEGIAQIDRGLSLDPHFADIYLHWLALAYFQLDRYEEAIAFLHRRLIRKPDTDVSRVLLAASYGQLGRLEDAKAQWAEALRVNPDYSLEHRRQVLPYKDPADFEKIVDGLRKAGLPA